MLTIHRFALALRYIRVNVTLWVHRAKLTIAATHAICLQRHRP